jgi:SAM-dependent methyltransferase
MTLSKLLNNHTTFSDNLANPEGFYGEVVGDYINAAFEGLNEWVIHFIDIQSQDQILELGFGPGFAIKNMASKTQSGLVIGIDNSSLMVQKATALNHQAIQEGKVRLIEADVCHLPNFDCKFDKIIAINTTMYWPAQQLETIFKNLRTHLVPGGTFYIAFQRLFEAYERGDQTPEIKGYMQLLKKAGFLEVNGKVQNIPDKEAAIADSRFIYICLFGTNPVFSLG